MTTQDKIVEIVIIKQPSLAVNVLTDLFTFGGILALLAFNHGVLGGSIILDIIFIVMILIQAHQMTSKYIHRFDTRSAALNYLKGRDF